ncbi:MAG: type I restriction endonuclease subunit R [Micrococcales bacterium]|nr:type I restriction endonuclease subunit R [Micrococcales bacterium]MCL2668044.1 type I restriction endonuclease subunit R [Micrococcales bacterium]
MNAVPPSGGQVTGLTPVVVSDRSTVVAEYVPSPRSTRTQRQLEAELEAEFIDQLRAQGYVYEPSLTDEPALLDNLRVRLESLNDYRFTDGEWRRLLDEWVAHPADDALAKTRKIHDGETTLSGQYALMLDDGTSRNIALVDRAYPHRNCLQVINQFQADGQARGRAKRNRFDVTILMNGLPMVHIELKARNKALSEAFRQINRYEDQSFQFGRRLFQWVQLFVISRGAETKYYSNTTDQTKAFDFTNYWADQKNSPIRTLPDFTTHFFNKHTLYAVLLRYMILTADDRLLAMRPYQIAATEAILTKINTAINSKLFGSRDAGGFVWHATGSGKTLTSFKAAKLAAALPEVAKVLFVVDRKDLDKQTIDEYRKLEADIVTHTRNTDALRRQIEDDARPIVVTTIQKLSRFVDKHTGHVISGKPVVIIYDECHRSQFGAMHTLIKRYFKKYSLFGFTGTPIFTVNAGPADRTTADTFGDLLHTYTVVDAIRDENVLGFMVEYNATKVTGQSTEELTEEDLRDPGRIAKIVRYVLVHHGEKTKGATFNSLLATANIKAARAYYTEFKEQQADLPVERRRKVAIIYSAPAEDGDESITSTAGLDDSDRAFLDSAISDYNTMFGCSYDVGDDFTRYYMNLADRIKGNPKANQRGALDIVIVVNMMLTGFDSKMLNTLWVDKNLRYHSLVQAFSRTNRIYGREKGYGHIVTFRDMEQAVEDAIRLYGGDKALEVSIMKPYSFYRADYEQQVADLVANFPLPLDILGESAEQEFIKLFGCVRRLRHILTSFDDYYDDPEPLSQADVDEYTGGYMTLYDKYKDRDTGNPDGDPQHEQLTFEIELIRHVAVNVDYILNLIGRAKPTPKRLEAGKGHSARTTGGVREQDAGPWIDQVQRTVDASPDLRDIRDLILAFCDIVDPDADVAAQWQEFITTRSDVEFDTLIAHHHLRPEVARTFMEDAYRRGELRTSGTDIVRIMPPANPFADDSEAVKDHIVEALQKYFDRFDHAKTGVPLFGIDLMYSTTPAVTVDLPLPHGEEDPA